MTDHNSTTESQPHESRWLDRLSNEAALAIMAEDQEIGAAAVKTALGEIEAAAEAIAARLEGEPQSRLFYAGAGTSIRIGVQDGVELTPTFDWPEDRLGFIIAGGEAALMRSVENAEDNAEAARQEIMAKVNAADVLIGLAASGSTPFTCTAVDAAKAKGALTIGIANNAQSPLVAKADYGITLLTGAESVAGSTRMKAGTAQKICLNLISTLVMVRLGRVKQGVMASMRPTNAKLRQRQEQIDAILNR